MANAGVSLVLAAVLTLVASAGCSPSRQEPSAGRAGAAGPAGATVPPGSAVEAGAQEPAGLTESAAAVPLEVVDEKQLEEVLKRHRGKVVLVDFWATWCTECLELMPHTVSLRRELGEQGLEVVLVSLDSEDRKDAVEKALGNSGATFASYISRYGSDPRSAEAFEIESAVLPNIKLYDRKGELSKVLSAGRMPPEPFDAEDVEQAVRELLAEK
ncbi:MAG: TlpA family protein disulfide reductase [Thermoguttaceae bacterium]